MQGKASLDSFRESRKFQKQGRPDVTTSRRKDQERALAGMIHRIVALMRMAQRFCLFYGLCACVIAQEVANAQNNTDVDTQPTAATTCPVPSPPPKDTVDDPVCSLCPAGMVLDPAMKDVAPQQEYAAEIAKALAQAGQSEFIPVVLSFVTCGCESLEYVFSSVTFNSFFSGVEGVEEQCVLFQQFLGSGEFPGGPEGCCKNGGEGTSSGGARSRSTFCWKKEEGGNIFGSKILSFGMLVALSFGAVSLMI